MKKFLNTALVLCIVFLTMALPVSACTLLSSNEITDFETSGIVSTDGALTIELSAEKDCYYVTDCTETASGEIVIPANHKGLPVTKLSATAFEYCEKITSIQLPETITEILCGTFYGCTHLEAVNLPQSIQYIGYSAFEGCDSLRSITINNKTTEKASPFTQTINGKEYSAYYFVRDGVLFLNTDTYIGNSLKIKSVNHNSLIKYPSAKPESSYTIPSDINEIWTDTFSSLKHLKEITIPASVTSLYSQAFHGYGKEYESPLTIIFQHTTFTGDLLANYALYDLPAGSSLIVKNEEVKETIQALDPPFATLFDSDEKISIKVNEQNPETPLEMEKNVILYFFEIIIQMLKNCTMVFN